MNCTNRRIIGKESSNNLINNNNGMIPDKSSPSNSSSNLSGNEEVVYDEDINSLIDITANSSIEKDPSPHEEEGIQSDSSHHQYNEDDFKIVKH